MYFLFFLNLLLCFFALFYDFKKTKLLITPMLYYSLVNICSLVYPVFASNYYPYKIEYSYLLDFLFIHTCFNFIFYFAYFFFNPNLIKVSGFRSFDLKTPRKINFQLSLFFLFCFFAFFILLCVKSGAGLLWLTDSREAYQRYREGVGFIYTMAIMNLYFSYFLSLSYYKSKNKVLIIYLILASFLGSKGIIICLIVFFYFYIKVIFRGNLSKLFKIVVFCSLFLIVYKLTTLLNVGFFFSFFKYFDYIINSAYFYQEFLKTHSDYIYGYGFVSDFFTFVPRILYSEKPFAYGSVLITDFLWPGLAEKGITPGKVEYLIWFYDFSYIGIVFFAIFKGILVKLLFFKSLKLPNLSGVILFMAVVGLPVFKYGSIGTNIVLSIIFSAIFLILSFICKSRYK